MSLTRPSLRAWPILRVERSAVDLPSKMQLLSKILVMAGFLCRSHAFLSPVSQQRGQYRVHSRQKHYLRFMDPNFDSDDAFQVLGLDPSMLRKSDTSVLDKSVLKKAYRQLAKKYHPDVAEGDKKLASNRFVKINWAYETLLSTNWADDTYQRSTANYQNYSSSSSTTRPGARASTSGASSSNPRGSSTSERWGSAYGARSSRSWADPSWSTRAGAQWASTTTGASYANNQGGSRTSDDRSTGATRDQSTHTAWADPAWSTRANAQASSTNGASDTSPKETNNSDSWRGVRDNSYDRWADPAWSTRAHTQASSKDKAGSSSTNSKGSPKSDSWVNFSGRSWSWADTMWSNRAGAHSSTKAKDASSADSTQSTPSDSWGHFSGKSWSWADTMWSKRTEDEKPAWRDEGFGSFGRGQGSGLRRSRRPAYESSQEAACTDDEYSSFHYVCIFYAYSRLATDLTSSQRPPSCTTSSYSYARSKSYMSSTSLNRDKEEAWRYEGFGSFGRWRGSNRRRSRTNPPRGPASTTQAYSCAATDTSFSQQKPAAMKSDDHFGLFGREGGINWRRGQPEPPRDQSSTYVFVL